MYTVHPSTSSQNARMSRIHHKPVSKNRTYVSPPRLEHPPLEKEEKKKGEKKKPSAPSDS